MMWWNNFEPGPWLMFGPAFFILMIVMCAVMMFFMMRGHRNGGGALQILQQRFARGEIDKTEYDERRRVLGA